MRCARLQRGRSGDCDQWAIMCPLALDIILIVMMMMMMMMMTTTMMMMMMMIWKW